MACAAVFRNRSPGTIGLDHWNGSLHVVSVRFVAARRRQANN